MLSRDFGVSRHGLRIHRLQADNSVQTGITFDVQLPGMVSFFEEYDAMLEANYSVSEWDGLRPFNRAEAVARYRLKRHISIHETEAMRVDMNRRKPKK